MKIGKPIPREEVAEKSVEELQDRVRTAMKLQMQPPVPDSVVFHPNTGYLMWILYIGAHVLLILLFRYL